MSPPIVLKEFTNDHHFATISVRPVAMIGSGAGTVRFSQSANFRMPISSRFFSRQNDANAMLRLVLGCLLFCAGLRAATTDVPVRNESLRNELSRAIDRGTDWLSK